MEGGQCTPVGISLPKGLDPTTEASDVRAAPATTVLPENKKRLAADQAA